MVILDFGLLLLYISCIAGRHGEKSQFLSYDAPRDSATDDSMRYAKCKMERQRSPQNKFLPGLNMHSPRFQRNAYEQNPYNHSITTPLPAGSQPTKASTQYQNNQQRATPRQYHQLPNSSPAAVPASTQGGVAFIPVPYLRHNFISLGTLSCCASSRKRRKTLTFSSGLFLPEARTAETEKDRERDHEQGPCEAGCGAFVLGEGGGH